ncbi:MAG: molecular chaperone HtpG [Clostridia bacterium]|nr:molecular chaperone HtpG [Clostridia bacterium]
MQQGSLSVNTEHLFPIIKKWLYSEKDIFIREVISNACDAVTKHKRLVSLSEADESAAPYRVDLFINKDEKTITVRDNGIGMTADEVDKYINNIALSGALDFISKYENEGATGIIGHFGLGFYSMFMVSDRVEMQTLSYQKDAKPVLWSCDDNGDFQMEDGSLEERGTEIKMFLMDEELGYLDYEKMRGILTRYCEFMPVEIYLHEADKEVLINETKPLWQKSASDCTDEEYKEFYKKQFHDYMDPLFWVHINADYPLNFKGILFMPQKKNAFDAPESEIRLFYNSVFVADNIKEVCPEFLINLKGVLDCPDLPLNVSRSYLQNDAYVRKVASHIVKKVADRLNQLFTQNREDLEKNWPGMRPYIEYGCVRDEKFFERVQGIMLFEKADGGWSTISEYLGESGEGTVYYTTDRKEQSYYLDLFASKNIPVLVFDTLMDTNYAQFLEGKNEKIKFRRIDSDLNAVGEGEGESAEHLEKLFKAALKNDKATIQFAKLGENDAPALVKVEEEGRRMADMMKMYSMGRDSDESPFPIDEILIVNTGNPLIQKLQSMNEDDEKAERMARQIYLSALLLSRPMSPEERKEYVLLNQDYLLNS